MYEIGIQRRCVRSARARQEAFTLIELLVVIAIIAVLMAILIPTLSRVRKQARAVVCQSQLKQWGTMMAASVNENNGRFCRSDWKSPGGSPLVSGVRTVGRCWGLWELDRDQAAEGILCCPVATKFSASEAEYNAWGGGTFAAWKWPGAPISGRSLPYGRYYTYGSYGLNCSVAWNWGPDAAELYGGSRLTTSELQRLWQTVDVRGRNRIPALLDSAWDWCTSYSDWNNCEPTPPECDAIPLSRAREKAWSNVACINRHSGAVNGLFLDWSVRKVGLKELWTLKWQRSYDTAGPWTKAGGVTPQDWPEWMRGFKDY